MAAFWASRGLKESLRNIPAFKFSRFSSALNIRRQNSRYLSSSWASSATSCDNQPQKCQTRVLNVPNFNGRHRVVSASLASASQSSSWSSDVPFLTEEEKSVLDTTFASERLLHPRWGEYSEFRLANVEWSDVGDRVEVTWARDGQSDGEIEVSEGTAKNSFPYSWLRDNCRCNECFNKSSKSRTVNLQGLLARCGVETVMRSEDGKSMTIQWKDGHVSHYPATWLRCNVFSESDPDPVADMPPQLWDAATCRDRIQIFDFNNLLSDDRALFALLREVKGLGIAIIENVPQKVRQIHRLAERCGYLTPSNYGETFHVKAKVDPSNIAYTSSFLSSHTDLTYFNDTYDIQMLHCIAQADGEGGENMLVDGFKIANDLRQSAPKLFDILTTEVLEYHDVGRDAVGDFFQHSRVRTIRLNDKGVVDKIIFSDHGRSAMLRMDVDNVVATYEALACFADLLYDPVNVFRYRMRGGDIVVRDNHRVLHGREAFTLKPGSSRHLEGGFLDWDAVLSKIRVLGQSVE
ncbi:gamma-butyrobetaine dioxygenase-like [Diadema antillarum]|uniref:gamma-butyrobetaine dioxygenase-like n=1 Tax=Diadema antillarum TaxID=105358 RepID=UPI003A896FB6